MAIPIPAAVGPVAAAHNAGTAIDDGGNNTTRTTGQQRSEGNQHPLITDPRTCSPQTCVLSPPIAHRGAGITAPTKTQAAVPDETLAHA